MEQHETLRKSIAALLAQDRLTAKELSEQLGIGEKEVYDHLEEMRQHKGDLHLVVTPAACHKCGFIFKKRERLKKPGRCPVCRCEYIQEPSFSLSGSG